MSEHCILLLDSSVLLALTPTAHFSCCTTGASTATPPALHHPGFPQKRFSFPGRPARASHNGVRTGHGQGCALAPSPMLESHSSWSGKPAHPLFQPSKFPQKAEGPRRVRRPAQRRTASIDPGQAPPSPLTPQDGSWAACGYGAIDKTRAGPDRRSRSEAFRRRVSMSPCCFLAQPAQPDRCADRTLSPCAVGLLSVTLAQSILRRGRDLPGSPFFALLVLHGSGAFS